MADTSRVVSRSAWGAIIVAAILSGTLLLSREARLPSPLFTATSYNLDLQIVDGITKAEKHAPPSSSTQRVIVPHHSIASEAIALGIRSLASSSPQTVLVISPDHFDQCLTELCTTSGSFETFFGKADVSEKHVQKLLRHPGVTLSPFLFKEEHGIYTIVPFIKHYLPEAHIVPIVLSQKMTGSRKAREKILAAIESLLEEESVALVFSTDFSHYLPLDESNEKDRETRKVFCSGNTEEILKLNNADHSDCPLCLWLAAKEAQTHDYWNPEIIWHSNSVDLLKDSSLQETTSHFVIRLGPEHRGCE